MRLFRVSLILVVALFLSVNCWAQASTSRLEGTVQDPSGALIPGAKVADTNVKTNIRAETTTDAQGRYIFPSLQPGVYTVAVQSEGFTTSIRSELNMTVGDTVTENIKLEVGSVTESVVVEANAVRVQTSDAQVGRNIMLRDLDVLPQLARGPMALAIYNTGVQIDATDSTFSRVNGTRQGSNNTTLDGIEVNDPVAPRLGLAMTPMNTDTVEEFRVITSGHKAEYGRNAGAQVQMITRSGSNEFHGGLWDYHRNTTLNANTFFSNQTGQTRPKFIQNSFGGRFAGRIFKDKTFFFGNYDGRRTRQEVVRNRTVLTPELKRGLFRWKTPGSGAVQSFDIARNDPRNKGIDPFVANVFKVLPDPNNFDVGDGLNTGGYRFNNPANSFNDQYTVKVDHSLTATHRTFFRWSWMRTYSIDTTNSADAPFPGLQHGQQGGHRMGWSAGSDWNLRPTIVNELRIGAQKSNSDFLRPGRLPEPLLYSNTFTDPYPATDFAQGRTVPYYEVTDNLTKVAGKHTIKFGGQLRLTTQEGWREDYIWPTIYVDRNYGNVPPSTLGPSGAATIASADRTRFENHYNEVLGRVSNVLVRYYSDLDQFLPEGTARTRTHKYREFGFFVQDDWKLRPNFSLNVGIRYEYFGVPFEANGLQGTLDKAALMNHASRITDFRVVKGAGFYAADLNNFAPRIGFAWDVKGDGKTAVRGSWGVFYDRMINSVLSPVDLNTPGFNQDVRTITPSGQDLRISDGIPATTRPAAPVLQLPVSRGSTVTVINPNLRTGYVLQSNLSVQQEIFRNAVLEVGYVGTRGIKLFMHNNLNQPRIYEGFLKDFKELQAFRSNGAAPSAANTIVKIFGTPQAAVTAIGASVIDQGAAGQAANAVDQSNYTRYAAAGVPDTYLRNFPQFNYAYLGANDGRSYYNSLQIAFRRMQGSSLKYSVNYTFSKAMDNWASEGNGTSSSGVMDSFNTRLNRARADFDKPHSLNANLMYTLPVGHNRKLLGAAPGWVDSILGGWEIGALAIWQSGSTFTVSSGRYTGPNQGGFSWADYSGDRSIGELARRSDGVYYFTEAQKALFGFPQAGEIGTSGRNGFRGPRFFNIDASLLKKFKVGEGKAFTFRAEAYNVLNNVNFGLPGASIATPASFGKISTTIGPNGSGGARLMQAALRFDF